MNPEDRYTDVRIGTRACVPYEQADMRI